MIARIAILAAIAIAIFFILKSVLASKQVSVRQFFVLYGVVMAVIVIVFLAVTGRLHPLAAAFGLFLAAVTRLLPLLLRGTQAIRILAMLKNMMGSTASRSNPGQQQRTEARSTYFNMILDHETGFMDGTVLTGSFTGRQLSELQLGSLLKLLGEVANNEESKMLLEAFLDRSHPHWRESDGQEQNATPSNPMTREEALSILDLSGQPSKQEIVQAHRTLMQKMHPDRGGSTYLAARINGAKDILITGL
ncbi:MAG TPA: molecular chaperone DnaJ [Gammaproteobacteria bacterium]|nr:molecular chaperone DnaJ [Gammaproteobacteria bacterium]HIK70658.1 molecular chaperone DnaJ [Pseudomonadales bacterium]